jgi:cbb3-type cytochrome oxidase subunit 1
MPRLSVWSIRAALLHLGTGLTLGAVMLAGPALHLPSEVLRLRPFHAEMLLIGWMVQLAFGVAYWILPRLAGGLPRGRSGPAWMAVLLLNAGVLAAGTGQAVGMIVVAWIGRMSESLAALTFAYHLWSRVGPSRTARA